jgi:hypothetical protein
LLDADRLISDPKPERPPGGPRLLQGPAGRKLCRLVALVPGFGPVRTPRLMKVARPGPQPLPLELLDEMEAVIQTGNYDRFLAAADERTLLAELAHVVVGGGLHRTIPGRTNVDERERAVLAPVAAAIVASRAARWWPLPVARDDQHFVHHDIGYGLAPPVPGSVRNDDGPRLAAERDAEDRPQVEGGEARASNRRVSMWWSRPDGAWSTTRSIPGLPAVGLVCFPDPHARLTARYWRVSVTAVARVYEIGAVEAWQDLVRRYPRDVTFSRRGVWGPLTGWDGPWLLPDWSAMAADFDGVHLSVTGYLEIVGRATPVDGARTMLVGWGPDETYWLNDVIDLVGEPVGWVDKEEDRSGLVIDEDGTY